MNLRNINILVLSKIYPANDIKTADTPVVHYFAKEWVGMGYKVKVVHNFILFPKIIYPILRKFNNVLFSKIGAIVPPMYDNRIREYNYDGIDIIRIPIKKTVPHGQIPTHTVKKQFGIICKYIDRQAFIPDVVVGHWWNPQLQLLSMLKEKYGCKTCFVIHDIDASKNKVSYTRYFRNIDVWGFRSLPLLKDFERLFGTKYKTFHCASGVPVSFITGNEYRKFDTPCRNIVYVGALIKRKHPESLMDALAILPNGKDYNLLYIGQGNMLQTLTQKAKKYDLKYLEFAGHIPRHEVNERMKEADIFIMISKSEVFGLVYLEAMGCGCITIASRNEGMDGIIRDGENGFLCEAGNETELSEILKRISNMSTEELKRISDNAVKTAEYYTDFRTAKRYIEHVITS